MSHVIDSETIVVTFSATRAGYSNTSTEFCSLDTANGKRYKNNYGIDT